MISDFHIASPGGSGGIQCGENETLILDILNVDDRLQLSVKDVGGLSSRLIFASGDNIAKFFDDILSAKKEFIGKSVSNFRSIIKNRIVNYFNLT